MLAAHAVARSDIWHAWNFDPMLVTGLLAMAAWYGAGVRRLWRTAGAGRGVRPWQVACFGAGMAALFVALVSPLDALGDSLFWAHMVQHLVLIVIAAPLVVLGAPILPMLWMLDPGHRRRAGLWWNRARILPGLLAVLTAPLVAWSVHVSVLWAWHLPAAYQAALEHEGVHVMEHLSFLVSALIFWWVALGPAARPALNPGLRVLYVVTAGMQGGLLGALLTFAGRPFYPVQSVVAPAWGLTALQDQQLAGLVMWLPAGMVYLVIAAWLFVSWLRAEEGKLAVTAVPG